MNISNPVASEVLNVEFSFLSKQDVKNLSVKRITNPTTFGATVAGKIPVPAPGGLYDPALGASDALRQRCSTCHLDYMYCPGHIGHIELPVGVYNPLFFDQLYALLRSTCVYCFHFKAPMFLVDKYACKLRLIQYGLFSAAQAVEDMQSPEREKKKKSKGVGEDAEGEDIEAESDEETDLEAAIAKRRKFVEDSISTVKGHFDVHSAAKVAAIAEERRQTVKKALKEFVGVKKCAQCQAYGPTYRKDGYSKIFEKGLSGKELAGNVSLGLRRRNTMVPSKSKDAPKKGDHVRGEAVDEGITMDVDEEEEQEEEDEEEEQRRLQAASKKIETLLLSEQVRGTLRRLFEVEQELVQLLYNPRSIASRRVKPTTPDIFFLDVIAVPPTKFRPPQAAGGDITEAATNRHLVKIIQDCVMITDRIAIQNKPEASKQDKLDATRSMLVGLVSLQESVNTFLDSTKSGAQGMAARNVEDGIKQKLEKKEGLFRKNMMGKRVNFAARSVISPDPNIETSEIGVPLVFAKKLTYPEPVTDDNMEQLMKLVQAGPDNWPGAVSIEMEDGTVQKLPGDKTNEGKATRQNLSQLLQTPNVLIGDAKPKKVHRHLQTGDYVIMNRQPTLHKPSMMGHRARVLQKERTIRMHYANCNTYNADFDGDEMNMHLPQNAIAQAEAREIANTDSQYLAGTAGKPLRGLIQDHLVMAVQLTNRDTMFSRSEYHQLMYSCLLPERNEIFTGKSSRIKTLPPAIIKPRPLWTGKQVITTILENIRPMYYQGLTLTSKSKVPGDRWYPGCEEGQVIFSDGYFACGILDKNQIGPSEFGFVHSIYQVYGPRIAGSLLSILGRLLTKFLHMRAHTCGMDDILLTADGDARRKKTLSGSRAVGRELSVAYVGLEEGEFTESELHKRLEGVLRDEDKQKMLDLRANSRTKDFTSSVINECIPSGLVKQFPVNNFQAMVTSGAKGSDVNASQISCLLGQQVLEGRRVPVMVSGKTLPCFKPYETDVRAGGYVTDRFLTGVRPQEYYFHCMAGREGLIDTAVKTSRSGYLQRCLVKGMEGIKVAYDNTVRDSDGSLVQFLYGEDGLDVTKQGHLTQFKFCAENMWSLLRRCSGDSPRQDVKETLAIIGEKFHMDADAGGALKKSLKRYRKKNKLDASKITMCEMSPSSYLGSVSEKFYEAREAYIDKNPDSVISKSHKHQKARPEFRISKSEFRSLTDLSYLRATIEPGEAVGIVAAQSIGEPSTQMTLNTFHLAGHATKNVTLGIPRLREIVMTASASIATPTMTLTLNRALTDAEADQFAKQSSRLMLSEVIDKVTVTETVSRESKRYHIHIDFFTEDEYTTEYSVTRKELYAVLRKRFMDKLVDAINHALNLGTKKKSPKKIGSSDALPNIGESAGKISEETPARGGGDDDEDEGGDEDSDEEDGEGGTASARQTARKQEIEGYEEPDDEEAEISKHAEQEDNLLDEEAEEDEGLGDSEHSDAEPAKKSLKQQYKPSSIEGTDAPENVSSYTFDSHGQWCDIDLEYPAHVPKVLMLNIVEDVCRRTIIRQLPNIGSVTRVPKSELDKADQEAGKRKLAVDGVNFEAFWTKYDKVDVDSIETNDVAQILKYYGVEAARNNIVKEMNAVFKGHGISVDIRHLNLIADIMTRGGGFTPFNRQGLAKSVSPFLKMSFETTCNFLKDAVVEGDYDDLTSPSSRIVLGKLSSVGSGSFDVMVDGF